MTLKTKLIISALSAISLTSGFSLIANGVTSTTISVPSEKLNPPAVTNSVVSESKRIEKLSIPSGQVIFVEGQIGPNAALIAEDIRKKSKTNSELYLIIDSPGGSVMDGAMILSAIESSSAKVNTVCAGLCASMAFVIHQYGAKRLAVDRSVLMAHPASAGLQGTLGQMESRLSFINRYVEKMDTHIAARVGMPLEAFKALTVSEYWIDAEDALGKHFVDGIVDVSTERSDLFSALTNQAKSDHRTLFLWE